MLAPVRAVFVVTGISLSPALLIAGIADAATTMAPTRVPSFRAMDRVDDDAPTPLVQSRPGA